MVSPNPITRCHSCRRSRLRCDGVQPTCLKCTSRGVECLGYGTQALLWVQSNASIPLKRGRPKLVLSSSCIQGPAQAKEDQRNHSQLWNAQVDLQQDRTTEAVRSPPQVPLFPMPAGYSDAYRVFDVLMYFNSSISSDMIVFDSTPNPYHINLEIWQYLPSIVMDFLSAVVATHRVIRSQTCDVLSAHASAVQGHTVDRRSRGLDAFAHPLKKSVYGHHRQVIQGLRALIDDGALQSSTDDIFGLISSLMTLEIQQSAYGPWIVHLEAMRTIISQRGGFRNVAREQYLPSHALHLFMLVDIMSCVTKTSSALSSLVAPQMVFLEYISHIHRDGVDVGFPCPNELLEAVVRINYLRSSIANIFDNQHSATDSQILELFERIISFSPTNWVRDRKGKMVSPGFDLVNSPATNYNNFTAAESPWSDSLALVSTFKMAVLLYFMRTLIIDRDRPTSLSLGNGLSVDINSIRSTASDSLLTYLHQLLRPDSPRGGRWLGKFLFWPLFIAGMECHYSSSMSMAVARKFIADSLCQLSQYQGDLSMLDAASFLQHIWRIQSGPDNHLCVDGMIYEAYKTDATLENPSCGTLPSGLISWDERVVRLGAHSLFML
ncbi:fungal-specific transcription factor domain-containing protein [Talaromyces proteolyticus]|uniref:Fungal-specific transcription factor domain-containing protein n=1 Tax=Talaromyces proteolyticus TaxID=1131652 RepID=A0AAD4KIE5_9EURO|nr:fungal-specific transcription factor domain-containing protein [Talaromyces proteolyticus]KAH8692963.1 fungal-specific transcription factor domain-containing protein [Talaromyces proteolyticus]